MRVTRRRGTGSVAETHRAWLELVDTEGPFLSIPVLKRVWPQGIPPMDDAPLTALKDAKPVFESAWEKWDQARDDKAALGLYRSARAAWVDVVLRDVLGWGDRYTTDLGDQRFTDVARGTRSPNRTVTVAPTGALVSGATLGGLVLVVDPVDSLRDTLSDGWAASPVDRMEELLRATGVPVGVVTDGRWWGLVSARPETMTASGIVDALDWVAEPATRDAYAELLRLRRLVGGRPEDRLPALFKDSVLAAEEITLALGVQVRRAVELLVQALSEASIRARANGQPDPLPPARSDVYGAAVTMMMRVVFLLFAEQRGLLPQTDLFDRGYGLSGRLDALDQRFREEGAEALDGTHLTWHRLLGASRLLYQGSSAEDLRLPAYGGSLFDPDRYAFLTACTEQGTLAIKVSDRVMLEVLRAVEVARVRGEARRLSFRDIDVEQIGYIYEGLLGYTTHEVDQVVVGVVGTQGEEPEIPLEKLERLRATHSSDEALADAIREYVEETQPSAKPPTRAALARALRTQPDDADRALRAVVSDDEALRHRLRTFAGMIRRDLRDRPLVVRPGGVMVVETPSRKTAGAHYTPRSLAEDVVGHALEPLVFHPGPHQTSDRDAWRPISSDRILALKVADIACGSGAFLVAAARYLADRLVEAWQREGSARGLAHELRTKAIRQVVARCLYGADINAMAVEMCKLSLWLVSLDPKLPFSFVDDKILHGNSLLGLTDVRQLKARHIDPDAARIPPTLFDVDVDAVLDDAARLRRELASEVDEDDPQRSTAAKRRQLGDLKVATAQLTDIANAVVAAGLKLGGKPGRALNEAYENLRIALEDAYPADGSEPDRAMLDDILSAGLTPQVETDYERWQPLHWVLAVPDVMERGGFDAVVGNPPFRGGKKISGDLGSNMREWLVNVLAGGTKGNADLVAYFFLRAFALLNPTGILGLLGTNTLGQGDTREVGLDRMVADGFTVTRCVQSTSWPVRESATLEIALVWGTRGEVSDGAPRMADGLPVRGISTLLEPVGRVEGPPARLSENAGIAFIGCYVLGMGFVLSPDEASSWIEDDPRNADVLFPYLNGEDLNSRPDSSASRSVIDFNDWSEERAEKYALPFERVAQRVKPERQRRNSKGDFVLRRPLPSRWWQYADKRPALRRAITGLDEVLAIALVSKTVIPMRVPAGQVFSHRLGVFATGSFAEQGVLSSTQHWLWAVTRSSTLETRVNYSPSDAFLTFPRSEITAELSEVGRSLDTERRDVMLRRQLGLTSLYNLVNSPDVTGDRDVDRMRDIHVGLDEAVMAAYGWDDVPLDHGFHTYRQMRRWTVSPEARVEILDRLLEENHRRAGVPVDRDDYHAIGEDE